MEKPKRNFVTFWRTQGNYNLCDSKQIDAQYVFVWGEHKEEAEKRGLARSFTFDIEKDSNFSPEDYSALDLAYGLRDIYNSYFFHSERSRAIKLVEFLEEIEESEEQKRALYNVEFAKYQVEYWKDKLAKYEQLV